VIPVEVSATDRKRAENYFSIGLSAFLPVTKENKAGSSFR
jgi:hypothetical protein